MVSKKLLLSAAVASAWMSLPALANVDLEAASPTKVKYAKESLLTTDKTTVATVDYYTVAAGAAADLDIDAKMGVGMNAAQKLFVRVDVTNALFNGAPSYAVLVGGAITSATIAQGGDANNYVIFEVTAAASKAQTDTFTVTVPGLKLNSNFSGTNYAITVYETLTGAVNQTSSLYNKATTGAVTVVTGLANSVAVGLATADVEQAFKKFVDPDSTDGDNDLNQPFGSATIGVAAGVAAKTGAAVAAADMFSAGVVKITGDFSVTTSSWKLSAGADCVGGSQALTVDAGKTFASTTYALTTAVGGTTYVCETATGATVLPESNYDLSVSYTAVANAAFPAATFTTKIGAIDHNGTTVQVPYLTTFADYNQRIVLVNRSASDAGYAMTFTPETGVTATAKAGATGTLKAKSTTVIKATDVVTITGNTRTAATIAIVSAAANIDAATTSINLSDKSSDTVKLK